MTHFSWEKFAFFFFFYARNTAAGWEKSKIFPGSVRYIKVCISTISSVILSTRCVCCTGNIPPAVLREDPEMTISQELMKSTHSSAHTSTGKRETEEEPEENGNKATETLLQETETREKSENPLERMTSWVEVENERQSQADMTAAAAAEGAAKVREGAARRVVLGLEGRPPGETDRERTHHSVEEELAMMEEKWREQCVINETLKQRLADEEERFRVRPTGRQLTFLHFRTKNVGFFCLFVFFTYKMLGMKSEPVFHFLNYPL